MSHGSAKATFISMLVLVALQTKSGCPFCHWRRGSTFIVMVLVVLKALVLVLVEAKGTHVTPSRKLQSGACFGSLRWSTSCGRTIAPRLDAAQDQDGRGFWYPFGVVSNGSPRESNNLKAPVF